MCNLERFQEGNCLFLGECLTYLEENSKYQNCKGVGFKTADFLLRIGEIHYLVEVKRLNVFIEFINKELKENVEKTYKQLKKSLEEANLPREVKNRINNCLSKCQRQIFKDLKEKLRDSLFLLTLNQDNSQIKKLHYLIFLCPYEGNKDKANEEKNYKFSYDVLLSLKDDLNRILWEYLKGFENCLDISFEVKVSYWKEPKPFFKVFILPFKRIIIEPQRNLTKFFFEEIEKSEEIIFSFGEINLTKRFIKSDPPKEEELKELIEFLDRELKKVKVPVDTLIGSGKTITILAALEYNISPYNLYEVNGKVLTKEQIKKWFKALSNMTIEKRRSLSQIEDKEAKTIIAGAAIIWRTLELFQKDNIIVDAHLGEKGSDNTF